MSIVPDIFDQKEVKNDWNTAKIVIQQKRLGKDFKIDIRVWAKNLDSSEYHPTRRGISLENSTWTSALPIIQEFINKY